MVVYNKKIYKKRDGRVLTASGPRESQKRLQLGEAVSTSELDSIRAEINILRNEFTTSPISVDSSSIDEVIEEVTSDIEKRYMDRISTLEATLVDKDNYIIKLEARLDKQDELIQKLTNSIGTVQIQSSSIPIVLEDKSTRPNIDSVFIDPTVKGSEDRLESFVKSKEVLSTQPDTEASINKLKNLIGNKLQK